MGGRRKDDVVVPAWGGRDSGKMFRIREWDAATAEKWAVRFVLVVKGTSAEIPASAAQYGMVEIARRGINAFFASDVDAEKLIPLLDELLLCVQIIRDQRARDAATNDLVPTQIVSADDIEEVSTRMWLRSEVLRVHTNFSLVDAILTWVASLTKSTPQAD